MSRRSFLRIIACGVAIALLSFLLVHFSSPINSNRYHSKLLETMERTSSFDDFTDALFRYEVTCDSVTTAYSIKNPQNWDIPSLEPRLTSFSYKTYLEQSKTHTPDETLCFVEDCLSRFSEKKLSKEDQYTYHLLKDYLNTTSCLSKYPFYEELLGSSSGIHTNLPVTLGEYPLRTEEDVKTYLTLLTQVPTYFEDVIAYEKRRQDLGYNQAPFVVAQTLETTQTMLNGFQNGDNSFLDTFNERITQIETLSQKDINKYKKTNAEYVEKYVVSSYEKIVAYLEEMLATYQPQNQAAKATTIDILAYMKEDIPYGICQLPKGADYYSHLTRQATGSNRPVTELISMTEQSLQNALDTIQNTALTNQDAYLYYCDHSLESYYENPEAILENLTLMIREDYPLLQNTPSYKIKTVSNSLASSLSPAFYMIPAVDDYKNNTIYINPLHTNEENGNLFPTLAHEGFPGHLYQTVYFNERNSSAIRQILNYLGYVEGWATYVELDSLTFLEYPLEGDALCKLYQAETIMNLALCARIDMGVNYEGWTLADTRSFFEELGFDSTYAHDVYAYVVEAPTNYLSYFIGYLEIMDIKDAYQRQELENYSEMEFHKRLLDVGPADFETVRKYVLNK